MIPEFTLNIVNIVVCIKIREASNLSLFTPCFRILYLYILCCFCLAREDSEVMCSVFWEESGGLAILEAFIYLLARFATLYLIQVRFRVIYYNYPTYFSGK